MIDAQKYIDSRYGTNKDRDSKPEHQYYLGIIQQILIEKNNIEVMYSELKIQNEEFIQEVLKSRSYE